MVSPSQLRRIVYDHYARSGRDMPWRRTRDPYRILVSEIMLQQTQVNRVLDKYGRFIAAFPDIRALARARLEDVLRVWQGLGYNRRALLLHKLARAVIADHAGKIPRDRAVLRTLPGIGDATAGALCAFAFGQPVVFIETNIRAVFLHHFFKGRTNVPDRLIAPLAGRTLDVEHPREWYYALMDYGSYLKRVTVNPSRRSSLYVRQSRFEGSDRQVRGRILKILLEASPVSVQRLCVLTGTKMRRCSMIIDSLCSHGLITKKGALCRIA